MCERVYVSVCVCMGVCVCVHVCVGGCACVCVADKGIILFSGWRSFKVQGDVCVCSEIRCSQGTKYNV